jgi:pimeloyl-ACP methyl ester carboxylesterase
MNRAVHTAAVLSGIALGSSSARAQPTEALSPCTVEGVPGPVVCGRLSVPERREDPDGRRIGIYVMVLKATGRPSLSDPVTFFAGGGVLPATRLAPFLSRALADVRRSRDILLIDQRGTGRSNALACRLELAPARGIQPDSAEIRKRVDSCVAEISTRSDPRAYSTTRAMHDVEQVRSWLGYGQLNLWGMSYGTKAAREYLRLYPARVRSVVLSGVVPRATAWWGDQAANAEKVLREYFRLCTIDAECKEAFPDPRGALDSLIVRLQKGNGRTNDTMRITVNDVRRVVFNRLSESWSAVTIPLLIQLALDGDVSAFLPPPRPAARAIPAGIFYGITCSEEFPRQDGQRIRTSAAGTFMGPMSALQHLAVCATWPRWDIEPGLWEEVRSDVPILVLSGALDHITPPDYAEPVVALLSNSRRLVLPLRGHNDFDPCVGGILQRFFERPEPAAVDAGCLANTPSLRFPRARADLPGRGER